MEPIQPLAPQHHKEFFIIGSIFTVLMLLVASGILYFENYPTHIVQQTGEQVATTATSTVLDVNGNPTYYSKDSKGIYIEEYAIKVSNYPSPDIWPDPNTFAVLDLWYRKDKDYVYMQSPQSSDLIILKGADPLTFTVLSSGDWSEWAKDKNHIYCFWSVVNEADAASFRTFSSSSQYALDINSVYYTSGDGYEGTYNLVADADPATFKLSSTTNSYDAQDKNHKYLQGQVIGTTTVQ